MAANAEEMKFDLMLTRFGEQYPAEAATLRGIFNETPDLRANALTAIGQDAFVGIEPLQGGKSVGQYDPNGGDVFVSITALKKAAFDTPAGREAANGLRYTLGHEIQHAIDRQAIRDQDSGIQQQAQVMIDAGGMRDYTGLLRDYNAKSRTFEARAEIAGFNALASYIAKGKPDATLNDLHAASPSNMFMYLETDPRRAMSGAFPKGTLKVGEDLRIERNDRNLEAIGQLFYDPNREYIKDEFKRGINLVAAMEADAPSLQPGEGGRAHVNLKDLGLQRVRLPPEIIDTAKLPRPVDDDGVTNRKRARPEALPDPVEGGSEPVLQRPRGGAQEHVAGPPRPTPDAPGHPDHPFYSFLRARLPQDLVPDNAVAHAMSLAKSKGIVDAQHVADGQVIYVEQSRSIVIGGNVLAREQNVVMPLHAAPSMLRVAEELEAQRSRSTQAMSGGTPDVQPHVSSQRH